MSSGEDRVVPEIVSGLEAVGRWRREAEADAARKFEELESEKDRVQKDIAELQSQLDVLSGMRDELDTQLGDLPIAESRKNREALLAGLAAEAATMATRSDHYEEADKARTERIRDLLQEEETSRLVEEYEQYQDASTNLSALPEGYRKAIQAHHETVVRRLEPVFDAVSATLPPVEALDPGAVTVVASVDPPEGPPTALALVVPVPFEVYAQWTERDESLSSLLAFRIVAALGAMLEELGVPDAPIQFAPYEGSLAISVWLGDATLSGDVREVLSGQFERMREDAAELATVRLELYTVWVSPDVVAPEASDEGAEAGPAAEEGADARA